MRRVVTGQGADGRSVVVSDGPAPQTVVVERLGGTTWEALWEVALPPASPFAGGDPTGPFTLQPAPGTASFVRVTLQPDSHMDQSDPAALFSEVQEKLPDFAAMSDPARPPGMHAMDTLDFSVIVSGRAVLVLDSGEVELGPGDCLVQQGSWHAWRIPWEEPCVLVGVSLRPGS